MIKKLKQILCSKKGLTLLEVIVASTISSIILIAALGFFLPTTENMRKIDNLNNAKMLSQLIVSGIEKKVKYASSVVIENASALTPPTLEPNMLYQEVDATDPTLTMLYFTSDGTTVNPVVEYDFYDNIRCDTTFTVSSKGTLKVKIVAHLKNNMTPIIVTETIVISYNGGASNGSSITSPTTEGNYLIITPVT